MKKNNLAAVFAASLLASTPSMATINRSNDPRAPQADISNAGHLFGDIFRGDPAEVSTGMLDSWGTLFGDIDSDDDESGDIYGDVRRKTTVGKILPYAVPAVTGTAGYLLGLRHAKRKAARVNASLAANARNATIQNQMYARANMDKYKRNTVLPFYTVSGATLRQFPLDPRSSFPALSLKVALDKQGAETPFLSEVVPATYALGVFTATATGAVTPRYYAAVNVTVGIPYLYAAPGTIVTIAGSFPTIQGTLVVGATPWTFTILSGAYVMSFIMSPWQLVTNLPEMVMGSYSNANPIVITVTGVPSQASVVATVPGTNDPWTISQRERCANL